MKIKYCHYDGKKLKKRKIKDSEIIIGECKKCGYVYPDEDRPLLNTSTNSKANKK